MSSRASSSGLNFLAMGPVNGIAPGRKVWDWRMLGIKNSHDSTAPILTWDVNSLASGASVDLTFQASVNASGEYANIAQVMTSDQYDPDSIPGNSSPFEDDHDIATITPQIADLSLSKEVNNATPFAGEVVTFTVTVTNSGPETATAISVEDVLPDGYIYTASSIAGGDASDDSSAPTLTWDVNSLVSGASVDLTFQAEVLDSGNHTNVAQVTACDQYDPDSVPANDDGDQSARGADVLPAD